MLIHRKPGLPPPPLVRTGQKLVFNDLFMHDGSVGGPVTFYRFVCKCAPRTPRLPLLV